MNKINPSELVQCKKCACFNLRKAARSITQIYDNALQPIDLRVTQFTLLSHVNYFVRFGDNYDGRLNVKKNDPR